MSTRRVSRMKKGPRAAMAAGFFVLLAIASPARALGPIGIEVAALGGGGTNGSYAPTLLGVGLGGRAGVTWSNLYFGAGAVDYLGATSSATGTVDSTHTTLVGGQLGYTFKLGVLRVRPLLDMGVAAISEAGSSDAAFYVQPGFTALVPIGPVFFGFDMNGLLIPSHARPCLATGCVNPPTADVGLTLHGQVGVMF